MRCTGRTTRDKGSQGMEVQGILCAKGYTSQTPHDKIFSIYTIASPAGTAYTWPCSLGLRPPRILCLSLIHACVPCQDVRALGYSRRNKCARSDYMQIDRKRTSNGEWLPDEHAAQRDGVHLAAILRVPPRTDNACAEVVAVAVAQQLEKVRCSRHVRVPPELHSGETRMACKYLSSRHRHLIWSVHSYT